MEEQKICAKCEKVFDELNEYDLCPDCEAWVQKEKREIEITNESLNNQF